MLDQDFGRMHFSRGSLIDDLVAPKPTLEDPATRCEVVGIMKSTMTQLASRLDTRITQ